MEYRELGSTGIKVSRLCFGGLTISPLQAGLTVSEGSSVILRALEKGVNFIDTAHIYDNYDHIRKAAKNFSGEVIIASKSYDYTYSGMEKTIHEALEALGKDYIDIFLLHEQESALTIKGHRDAVDYLVRAKEKGYVRAIGISTHRIEGVKAAALEPDFDVIHPIINMAGIGIQDGTPQEMLETIKFAVLLGKGVYGMKALGGGHLIRESDKALQYVLSVDELSSVAVGMQSFEEVDFNIAFFAGEDVPAALSRKLQDRERRLHIEDWCSGCGKCVQRCTSGALDIAGGQARVDHALCRLCGYCGTVCPQMCIKII